jgi:glycosyltransferase involved in cell wall biosynthesis
MPTHNQRPDWLRLAVMSVLNQSHFPRELIIVTAPGDENRDLLSTWERQLDYEHPGVGPGTRDRWLKVIEAPAPSVHGQWAYGMQHAAGSMLTKCDSDDFLLPGKLELEVGMLDRNEDMHVGYTGFFYCDEGLHPGGRFGLESYIPGALVRACVISESAVIRTDLWKQVDWLDTTFGYAAYWDAVLKMTERVPDGVAYDSVPTWLYRQHQNQVSGSELQTKKYQELRWLVVKNHFARIGREVPDWEISVEPTKMGDV